METSIFTKFWFARLLVSLIGAAGISFAVADYVVKANMHGVAQALEATLRASEAGLGGNAQAIQTLQSTTILISENVQKTGTEVASMNERLQSVLIGQEQTRGQIDLVAANLARLESAVEAAGIRVNFNQTLEQLFAPSNEAWSSIRAKYGISEEAPIFLEVAPPSRN